MNSKKRIRDIAIFLIVALVVLSLALILYFNNKGQAEGKFIFKLVDLNEEVVIEDSIDFDKDDKLFDIMNQRYEVLARQDVYGNFILDINGILENKNNCYLALYINDKYAVTGVDSVVLEDSMVIKWVVQSL